MYFKLKLSVFFIISLMSVPIAGHAQTSVCPVTVLRIGHLNGRVVWKDTHASLANATVELFENSGEQTLLETVETGNEGEFRFNTSRKGNFALNVFVDKKLGLSSYWVPVNIKRWNASDGRSILILRGIDCWESEARVEKIRKQT